MLLFLSISIFYYGANTGSQSSVVEIRYPAPSEKQSLQQRNSEYITGKN